MKKMLVSPVALIVFALCGPLSFALQQAGETKQERDKKATVKVDTFTVHVHGVDCDRCAEILTKALKDARLTPNGELTPNENGPSEITVKPTARINWYEVAKSISEVKTPHMDSSPPGISLILYAPANSIDETAASEVLEGMKGIESAESKVDSETGEIHLKFSGTANNDSDDTELTVNSIIAKLRAAGINAKPSKSL